MLYTAANVSEYPITLFVAMLLALGTSNEACVRSVGGLVEDIRVDVVLITMLWDATQWHYTVLADVEGSKNH